METEPARGSSPREATRTSVVLPEPFGPIRPVNSPGRAIRDTPSSTTRDPYPAVTAATTRPRSAGMADADPRSGTSTRQPSFAPEEIEEERAAQDGRHGAHRDLLRADRDAGGQVGQHHEGGPAQDRSGDEPAMIRPDDQPKDVGRHQAHESDQTRHRNGR